jgi:hypothetical protein
MLRYHYQYVTVLPQCDAIVSKKSDSVMAGGANDAETLCSAHAGQARVSNWK